jgi:hypothetical protein
LKKIRGLGRTRTCDNTVYDHSGIAAAGALVNKYLTTLARRVVMPELTWNLRCASVNSTIKPLGTTSSA